MTLLNASEIVSTRPYLIRALYEWCSDNGFTPYVAVQVDDSVRVPRESVKNGEIVLNISMDATSALKLGNDYIEFKARFGGVARDILVPIDHVMAIYARENGQGMAFPVGQLGEETIDNAGPPASTPLRKADESNPKAGQPSLKPHLVEVAMTDKLDDTTAHDDPEPPNPSKPRPTLKRVK